MRLPSPLLDPRTWKREHQLALLLAAAVGCVAAAFLMRSSMARCFGRYENIYGDVSWLRLIGGCWFTFLSWPAVGAAIGIALVYIRQLLRS